MSGGMADTCPHLGTVPWCWQCLVERATDDDAAARMNAALTRESEWDR